MARRVLLMMVAGLVAVRAASAHVVANPAYVQSGGTATIALQSPNERDAPMTGFAVSVPKGVEILHANPTPGWQQTVRGSTATWTGSTLPAGAEATFSVHVSASADPGTIELDARQIYSDGDVRWPVSLTVTPSAQSPSENLALAGVVGLIGVLVLGVVAALAWRRRTA